MIDAVYNNYASYFIALAMVLASVGHFFGIKRTLPREIFSLVYHSIFPPL